MIFKKFMKYLLVWDHKLSIFHFTFEWKSFNIVNEIASFLIFLPCLC